jgi:hypothetical protein
MEKKIKDELWMVYNETLLEVLKECRESGNYLSISDFHLKTLEKLGLYNPKN